MHRRCAATHTLSFYMIIKITTVYLSIISKKIRNTDVINAENY